MIPRGSSGHHCTYFAAYSSFKKFCSVKFGSLGIVGLRIHWRIRPSFWCGLNGDQFVLCFVAIPVRNNFLAFCHPVFLSAVLSCSKVMSLFGLPLANNAPKHLEIFLGVFFAICCARIQLWVLSTCSRTPDIHFADVVIICFAYSFDLYI